MISPSEELWLGTLAARACDACLDRIEAAETVEPQCWAQLGMMIFLGEATELCIELPWVTTPRNMTDAERALYVMLRDAENGEGLGRLFVQVLSAATARRAHAEVALLRHTIHAIQSLR